MAAVRVLFMVTVLTGTMLAGTAAADMELPGRDHTELPQDLPTRRPPPDAPGDPVPEPTAEPTDTATEPPDEPTEGTSTPAPLATDDPFGAGAADDADQAGPLVTVLVWVVAVASLVALGWLAATRYRRAGPR